ncbi:hypothetical protein SPSIL_039570 [Sporomusa silvacetica DSM 10669]|uniref:Uncharacterized protein n=1 Tax=Sporomusa silvacetica DSM 10669 TaxID=1123289 RepID=A0ABZ3IQS3_9FIRM|nr:hypothetical protein SPSIL_51900 [Sporomusa silvacetica DSM 10669]
MVGVAHFDIVILSHFGSLLEYHSQMDLTEIYQSYSRFRNNQATPKQMIKILLYAYMNRCVLLGLAHNVNKLHNKIQAGRCRGYLHPLKVA